MVLEACAAVGLSKWNGLVYSVGSNVVGTALSAEPCQELPRERAGWCNPMQQLSCTSSCVPGARRGSPGTGPGTSLSSELQRPNLTLSYVSYCAGRASLTSVWEELIYTPEVSGFLPHFMRAREVIYLLPSR